MDLAVANSVVAVPQPTFEDGLGERRYAVSASGELLEVLQLSRALSTASSFEFALRERASRLASFRHASFARVRAVELDRPTSALVVVSDCVPGVRLSRLLAAAEQRALLLDIDAARCLIRQLVRAMSAWHEAVPDACHGAIGPERLIVTPDGRVVVSEYIFGSALEQLRYPQARYWTELGIAVPGRGGAVSFDARADVAQVGVVALTAILGRRLSADVYPDRIREVVAGATARSATGELRPLSADGRGWLLRALQLDQQGSFASVSEAQGQLDRALGDANPLTELAALKASLAWYAAIDSEDVAASDAPDATVPDINLAPRIDALKSFLARYPSPRTADAPSEDAAAPTFQDELPAPPREPSPSGKTEPDWTFDPPSVDEASATVSRPQEPRGAVPVPLGWLSRRRIVAAAIIVVIAAALTLGAMRILPSGVAERPGVLTIETNPVGLAVFIDGAARGVTPLSVDLVAGDYVVELATGQERRRIPVTITAGGLVSQVLEFAWPGPGLGGELQVRTDPARVSVTIDGRPVGLSPLTVKDLSPGPHRVVLQHESGPAVTEQVLIEDGRTASLVVSMAGSPSTNAAGWIAIQAPADMQIYENQRLLGSSSIDRIMLPVGRHELTIVNEELGYREVRSVEVAAGQVSRVALAWPQGSLALNAVPWAEVWIDGQRVGETPIGNVEVPIGVREIVFRHPSLGERRSFVTVKAGTQSKVGVDLRVK